MKFLFSFLLFTQIIFPQTNDTIMPPKAKQIEKKLTSNGNTRTDKYFWLNERNNDEVLNYLKAENEYTSKMMEHTEALQKKIYNEIINRIKQDDQTVPYFDNGYFYYTKFEEGKEYPIYCRKKDNLNAAEEIILNVNEMAKGYAFYKVVGLSVSPHNKILAFGVDTLSRRKYDIFFKDLETGQILADKIPTTSGSAEWANDNKTIFYSTKDPQTLRASKILKHKLFDDTKNDIEIFDEKDETFYVDISKSKSNKYLMIYSYSTLSTEYRFLDADNPDGIFQLIQPREKNHEYNVYNKDDKFYILTNYKAKNFRLMETPVSRASKVNWKEVVGNNNDFLLEGLEVFNDFLVLQERGNALTKFRVLDLKNNSQYYIAFDEGAYTVSFAENENMSTKKFRYNYTSLTTPNTIYDYDLITKEKTLLKQDKVEGNFNSDNYKTERLFAEASDGVKIPISIVYRKDLFNKNGNPLLLYGYGSYGISTDPTFISSMLSLLDRGFIFAIAHIRGGQELGRNWYDTGKLLKKKNTFTDFIACAEYLIKNNYTNSDKLFAEGGSAGGLLMGAVVNMRPDLFKGVIAAVPFVDVITTMLDETIPLTTGEYDEWGNPNKKKFYNYI
ncbi:MAG: S9 family peptidase, partial [Ignavibacteriaceae bacterium]